MLRPLSAPPILRASRCTATAESWRLVDARRRTSACLAPRARRQPRREGAALRLRRSVRRTAVRQPKARTCVAPRPARRRSLHRSRPSLRGRWCARARPLRRGVERDDRPHAPAVVARDDGSTHNSLGDPDAHRFPRLQRGLPHHRQARAEGASPHRHAERRDHDRADRCRARGPGRRPPDHGSGVQLQRDEIYAVKVSGPRGSQARCGSSPCRTASRRRSARTTCSGASMPRPAWMPLATMSDRGTMLPLTDATIAYVVAGILEVRDATTVIINRELSSWVRAADAESIDAELPRVGDGQRPCRLMSDERASRLSAAAHAVRGRSGSANARRGGRARSTILRAPRRRPPSAGPACRSRRTRARRLRASSTGPAPRRNSRR